MIIPLQLGPSKTDSSPSTEHFKRKPTGRAAEIMQGSINPPIVQLGYQNRAANVVSNIELVFSGDVKTIFSSGFKV